MKKIFLVAVLALLAACTSRSDAERALTAQGFTEIEVLGPAIFACSEDDFYKTKFRAKNPQGKMVEGVVCSGFLFKNATIRF